MRLPNCSCCCTVLFTCIFSDSAFGTNRLADVPSFAIVGCVVLAARWGICVVCGDESACGWVCCPVRSWLTHCLSSLLCCQCCCDPTTTELSQTDRSERVSVRHSKSLCLPEYSMLELFPFPFLRFGCRSQFLLRV